MQLRHDDFGCRNALFAVNIGRDAAAIILDRNRPIGVQLNDHAVAMTGQRLVNGIVRDFEDHVVQARPVIGIADIHAGPLAHGIQALENLDRVRAIIGSIRGVCDFVCHVQPIGKGAA